jgi:replication factor C subunit 2/4
MSETLLRVSNGDLRKAITTLQSAHTINGSKTNEKSILEVAGLIPDTLIEKIWKAVRSYSFSEVQNIVFDIQAEGYPTFQVLSQFFDRIVTEETLSDKLKSEIAEKIAATEQCLSDGADEFLQLFACLSFCLKVMLVAQ